MLPHKIQPRENSKGSGFGGILYNLGSSFVNDNGNRNYPYLNCNDGKRKLNLNWNDDDNQWNDNWRFLALRKSFYSLPARLGRSLAMLEEFIFYINSASPQSFCRFQTEAAKEPHIFYYPKLLIPTKALRKILSCQI